MKEQESVGNRELHGPPPASMLKIETRPKASHAAYEAEARKMIARGYEVVKVTRRHWPIKNSWD